MKSETEHYQKVCTDAGVQFIEADGQFVFFQDVITKEKLKVEVKKFNNQRAQAEVALRRKKYPKDIEMLSDFTDAALAATLVVQQFILTAEGKNNGSTQKAA
jgi:hypothetical protein